MTDPCNFRELAKLNAEERAALLRRSEADLSEFTEKTKPIIEAVRREGDAALVRFAREFDQAIVRAEALKASEAEFDAAFKTVGPDVIEAIKYAVANIRTFHEEQRPEPMWMKEVRPGAFAGDRWTPLTSVALYVPRGKGAFPSVTMMTSVPAVVAGVKNIAICTPPTKDGWIDAATLVAARTVGVSTVYKCGGAPAGPSEALIFADGTVDGRIAALDVLIEAEHGPDSSAYIVTPSREVAEAAQAALPEYWARMTPQRVAFSEAVLRGERGGVILTGSLQESYDFINAYAPEHLEILSAEPFRHLGAITEAAEILMGPHTPVTIANFVLGPNCVLPTSRWARTYGPLSVTDFLKRSSVGYVTSDAYPGLAARARTLAHYEGFSSHENAVSEIRDKILNGDGRLAE